MKLTKIYNGKIENLIFRPEAVARRIRGDLNFRFLNCNV